MRSKVECGMDIIDTLANRETRYKKTKSVVDNVEYLTNKGVYNRQLRRKEKELGREWYLFW